jgi:hypothetical protein
MRKESLTLAASHVVSTDPTLLMRCRGRWNGAGAAYVQIHDARSLPADTAVPKARKAVAAGAEWDFGELDLWCANGVVMAFSSTESTLTVATGAGNNGVVEAEGSVPSPRGTLSLGTDTDGEVAVWTDANGPKQLVEVVVVAGNVDGDPSYVMVFPAAPSLGHVPVRILGTVADNETKRWQFGPDGWSPKRETSAYAINDGCYIGLSATAATYTPDSNATITALYK